MEKVTFEHIRWVVETPSRQSLAGSESIACVRGEHVIDPPCIDQTKSGRAALLVRDHVAKPRSVEGVEGKGIQAHTTTQRHIYKCIGFNARPVVENTFDPKLKTAGLVHPGSAIDHV